MSATRLLILGACASCNRRMGTAQARVESWRRRSGRISPNGLDLLALNKDGRGGTGGGQRDRPGRQRPCAHHLRDHRPGEIEFHRLLREFWWEYKPIVDPFMVALPSWMDLPRDELIAALRHHASLARLAADGLPPRAECLGRE